MEADKQSLEKLYAGMSTDELMAIKPDTLTGTAKAALSAEIAKRNLAPEEQSKVQGAIQNAKPFKESTYKEFHKEIIIAIIAVRLRGNKKVQNLS